MGQKQGEIPTDRGIDFHDAAGYIKHYLVQGHLVSSQNNSHIIKTTLLVLGLENVDIILGANWMTRHQVVFDVASRIVEINSPICGSFTLFLPSQDSTQSCAFAMTELPLKKIPVVYEYADVFPDELPGMPPDRDIEFAIELQLGTTPISKRP